MSRAVVRAAGSELLNHGPLLGARCKASACPAPTANRYTGESVLAQQYIGVVGRAV